MVIKFVRIVSIGLCWRHMDRLLLLTLMAVSDDDVISNYSRLEPRV